MWPKAAPKIQLFLNIEIIIRYEGRELQDLVKGAI
jgi:hypothetical protein